MLDNKCVTSSDQKDGLFLPECWLLKEKKQCVHLGGLSAEGTVTRLLLLLFNRNRAQYVEHFRVK